MSSVAPEPRSGGAPLTGDSASRQAGWLVAPYRRPSAGRDPLLLGSRRGGSAIPHRRGRGVPQLDERRRGYVHQHRQRLFGPRQHPHPPGDCSRSSPDSAAANARPARTSRSAHRIRRSSTNGRGHTSGTDSAVTAASIATQRRSASPDKTAADPRAGSGFEPLPDQPKRGHRLMSPRRWRWIACDRPPPCGGCLQPSRPRP